MRGYGLKEEQEVYSRGEATVTKGVGMCMCVNCIYYMYSVDYVGMYECV